MTTTQHLIRFLLLAGFAMLIVYLFRTGDMTLFIAPKMELLVKLSAIGLYAAAIYQLYAALKARRKSHAADCDCDHQHSSSRTKNIFVYSLFILPLALGFLTPTGTLGSALAAKKGMSFTGNETISRSATETSSDPVSLSTKGSPGNNNDNTLDELFPYDEYTVDHARLAKQLYEQPLIEVPESLFIETLTALDLYRDAFMGKEIEISGFIYREEDMGEDRMAISRFAMNCCSADALPYGLMTTWPKANEYVEDDWVKGTGKLSISNYMGNDILTVELTKIERIPAPASPYVYPDLEFGF
ncbi:TIGR03943 family putative permease subunit [Paenibacillus sp. PAMC21692]|uniref:TIGR03943 family putative permease subunit n=1 Tax=Paenibacillus sp. PAMC21692 TaxID=2762320 RepID=UPI00164CE569|nr:TIGR03943 family protein [Paenibacillus sp. PAMC21692]QNK56203.1 TIGR03943 family protein [Paenibacillus sp. PAMC21692]